VPFVIEALQLCIVEEQVSGDLEGNAESYEEPCFSDGAFEENYEDGEYENEQCDIHDWVCG